MFSQVGWLGGLCLFSFIGILNIYTMLQNLKVAEQHPNLHSYSEIGRKLWGKAGKLFVDIPILILQLGLACNYTYFIA